MRGQHGALCADNVLPGCHVCAQLSLDGVREAGAALHAMAGDDLASVVVSAAVLQRAAAPLPAGSSAGLSKLAARALDILCATNGAVAAECGPEGIGAPHALGAVCSPPTCPPMLCVH
eukprot:364100-Chlamydomonas_euryale.AAC.56